MWLIASIGMAAIIFVLVLEILRKPDDNDPDDPWNFR